MNDSARPSPAFPRPPLATGVALAVALALGACGGGGSGDEPAGLAPAAASGAGAVDTLLVGDAGTPAASVDENTLRVTAAAHAARGLGVNARALGGFGEGMARTLSRVDPQAESRFRDFANRPFDDGSDEADGAASGDAFDSLGGLDEDTAAVLRATLGLDGDDVRATRDGDSVTIDPDDAAVCAALEPAATGEDARHCRELASRLDVRLDALSADSGWLAYRFDGGELLRIGYGPVNSVYELSLAGVAALAYADATSSGEDGTDVASMGGRLRLSIGAEEHGAGRERGSLELAIVDPIVVEESDGTRLEVAASTVLAVEADASTARLRVRADLGALSMRVPADGESGQGRIDLPGLTADLTFDARDDTLVATRVGIGRGPFVMTVDSVEVLRLALGDFGFRLDGDGRLALSGDLAAALVIGDVAQGGRIALDVAAPTGTVVEPAAESIRRVADGSFDASLSVVSDGEAHEETLSLIGGQCATDDPYADGSYPDEPYAFRLLPTVVPCPR